MFLRPENKEYEVTHIRYFFKEVIDKKNTSFSDILYLRDDLASIDTFSQSGGYIFVRGSLSSLTNGNDIIFFPKENPYKNNPSEFFIQNIYAIAIFLLLVFYVLVLLLVLSQKRGRYMLCMVFLLCVFFTYMR